MPTSIYSYVLNLIRQGFSQAASFTAASIRFTGVDPEKIFGQWLTAWAGKYTADMMRNTAGSTFNEWLTVNPIGASKPGVNDDPDIIQSWFGSISNAPYDITIISSSTVGEQVTYGTWRYRLNDDDTYSMYARTTEGLIVKDYKIGKEGVTILLNQYIIGIPKDLI